MTAGKPLTDEVELQRRAFLGFFAGGLLSSPLAALAQLSDRLPRIGYVTLNRVEGDPRSREAFFQGLRDAGYVEGRNLTIEHRDAAGQTERFPALVAELVALKVDVIVTAGGTLAALAAKRATTTIPIVFSAVGDPVSEGIVTSLARPGGNVTGSSVLSAELMGKSLELLKQAVPGVGRVALLMKPDAMPERAKNDRIKAAHATARALDLKLHVVEARGPEDFDRAFSEITRARAGALSVHATPVFDSARRRLIDLADKNRLPTVYSFRGYVDAGGLMSYGPDLADANRRAAIYVDKILKGAKPGDLPVEQPTKFDLVINLKTAKTLRLTIPQSLLLRADQVIE